LAADLWSKHAVFATLDADSAVPILGGLIELRRSLNDGAVFGSFTGYVGVFIVASILALAFVLHLFAHSRRTQWVMHVALAMVLAGALGNLFDRAWIQADVVRVADGDGLEFSVIGTIVSDDADGDVRIGDWPDGANARRFPREKVTVRRQGVVRDFIRFVPKLPAWVPKLGGRDAWPWVFNVADAALVVGVILLLLSSLFDHRPRERAA
jgi:lipoprotein signal peptidase